MIDHNLIQKLQRWRLIESGGARSHCDNISSGPTHWFQNQWPNLNLEQVTTQDSDVEPFNVIPKLAANSMISDARFLFNMWNFNWQTTPRFRTLQSSLLIESCGARWHCNNSKSGPTHGLQNPSPNLEPFQGMKYQHRILLKHRDLWQHVPKPKTLQQIKEARRHVDMDVTYENMDGRHSANLRATTRTPS